MKKRGKEEVGNEKGRGGGAGVWKERWKEET